MSNVLTETFETPTTGYDNSWNTNTSGSGTLNPVYATSNVGSPSGWGSQCLQAVQTSSSGDECYIEKYFSVLGVSYIKIEVDPATISGITSGNQAMLLEERDNSSNSLGHLVIRYDGTGYFFRYEQDIDSVVNHDSGYITAATIYIVEVKWDTSAKAGEVRIYTGGSLFYSDTWTYSSSTTTGLYQLRIGNQPGYQPATIVYDNVLLDDATWPYTPGSSAGFLNTRYWWNRPFNQ